MTTPPFSGVQEIQFNQDPKDPTIRQVVATLAFTHSVNHKDLERHIALSMIGGSNVFADKPAPFFTVTYGLHDRLAYVRSLPLALPEHEDFMKLVVNKGVATTQGGVQTTSDVDDKVRVPTPSVFSSRREQRQRRAQCGRRSGASPHREHIGGGEIG